MGSKDRVAGTQVIGAVVHGGVAHIHQTSESSLLDEDDFFAKTGLRMSWPARVCLGRLLHEDVLLGDLRVLINAGTLAFTNDRFELRGRSDLLPAQRLEGIAQTVDRINPQLPAVLTEARQALGA
jgi:hypothetical protein